ncbi:hypothetical protein IC582_014687 [Cucumis melo]
MKGLKAERGRRRPTAARRLPSVACRCQREPPSVPHRLLLCVFFLVVVVGHCPSIVVIVRPSPVSLYVLNFFTLV